MKTLVLIAWFLLLYSLGALVLVFPEQYTSFKWSLFGFILFFGLLIWAKSGWKPPWKGIGERFNQVMNIFLVGVFFSLLGYTAYQNPFIWDMTEQKVNKVSESTQAVLKKVKEPLKITVLAEKKNWQQINDFFTFFTAVQSNIKVEMFSPDQRPTLLQTLGIKKVPAYLYEYKKQTRVGYHLNEIELIKKTNSLLGVQPKNLCWVEGFAGVEPADTGRTGGSYLKSLIELEGYHLITTDKPLDSCDSYVALGFNSTETQDVERLKSFLGKKPFLLAIDPDLKKSRPQAFSGILKEAGIEVNNNVVIDRESQKLTGQVVNLSLAPGEHKIFQGLSNPLMLPLSTSFKVAESVQKLLITAQFPKSWAETDLDSLVKSGEVSFSSQDIQGPIPVMVETTLNSQPLFVVGTSQFVTNAFKSYSENFHFFLNLVSTLLGEDVLAGTRPQIKNEILQFNQSQLNLVTYLCLIVTPLSFLLIAFYCYRRRANR